MFSGDITDTVNTEEVPVDCLMCWCAHVKAAGILTILGCHYGAVILGFMIE